MNIIGEDGQYCGYVIDGDHQRKFGRSESDRRSGGREIRAVGRSPKSCRNRMQRAKRRGALQSLKSDFSASL